MNEVLTPILARVTRGTELLPEEIEAALAEILEGRVADIQAAGFIVALRTKGESVEELAALVRTMHRYAAARRRRGGRDRHVRYGRRPFGHDQRVDDGRADRGGRGRACREARQPRAVVEVRFGRRARGAGRRDRARTRRRVALRRRGRHRLLPRAALPPGDAVPRSRPQGARRCPRRSTSSDRSRTRRT